MSACSALVGASMRFLRSQLLQAFVVRASGVLLSVVVTSLAARLLLPEKFGQFSVIISTVMILSIPATTGFRQLVTREVAYGTAQGDLTQATATWTWAMRFSLKISVFCAVGMVSWGLVQSSEGSMGSFLLGAAVLVSMPIGRILTGVLHGFGQVVASQTIEVVVRPLSNTLLFLVAFAIAQPGSVPVELALAFYLLATMAEAIAGSLILGGKKVVAAFSNFVPLEASERKRLTLSAISFGAIGGVQAINGNLDILMVGALAGPAEAGLYRAATSLAAITSFGLVVVNLVIMPKIAALHKTFDHAAMQAVITRSVNLISLLALAGAAFLYFVGPFVIATLFGAGYSGAYWALVILAAGQFANAVFGPVALVLNMTGLEKLTLIGVGLSTIANIILNLALVPQYGIEGAAIATATSMFLWNATLAVTLRAKTGLNSSIFRLGW